MATVTGTRYTYTDTANIAIDMSDSLGLLDPSEVALLSLIGKDGLTADSTKHEWLEDVLRPLDSTLTDNPLTSGATTVNVAAGTGVYFRAGDVLRIESELVLISAVATDALTISRGYGGSTAAAHVQNTAVAIVGQAILQDAGQGASRSTTKVGQFNYTQLYEDTVVVTSTQQAIQKWVEQNEMDAQLGRALKIAWMNWERSLLFGRKVAPAAGVGGFMDGILTRIATNAYAKAGAYLVEDFILQGLQDIWAVGGRADTLVVGAFQKRQTNKFLDSMRMTTRTDRIAGAIVDTYTSDFGTVDVVLDRQMPADTVLLLEKARVKFGPFRDHSLSAAPVETTTRLKNAQQIIGQYTAEIRNENAHAKITGLATS